MILSTKCCCGGRQLVLLLLLQVVALVAAVAEGGEGGVSPAEVAAPVEEETPRSEALDAPVAEALVQDAPTAEALVQDAPTAEALYQAAPAGSTAQEETENMSPADKLRIAAKKAGYDITDLTVDLASSATAEQLTKMLPQPLAEALIDRRRRPDLRDRIIGLTFLGQPVPLDRRLRKRPFLAESRSDSLRRRFGFNGPSKRRQPNQYTRGIKFMDYIDSDSSSSSIDIIKPISLPATRSRIIFPDLPSRGESHPRNKPQRGFPSRPSFTRPGKNGPPPLTFIGLDTSSSEESPKNRPFGRPRKPIFTVFDHREESSQQPDFNFRPSINHLPVIRDNLGNDVSSDFGPVTYDYEDERPNSFQSFERPLIENKKPSGIRPVRPSKSRRPGFPSRPKPFSPSKPFSTAFNSFGNNFGGSQTRPTRRPLKNKSACTQYTETVCLDADHYPHAEILASLAGDKGRSGVLIAEVRNQSADDLVDGISARQEEQYDYRHYFGNPNRRQDSEAHRDFADDGGYLCPSEVKYARPKRARNSKGEWKYIVNMDKYTQTIRMEKCIKPGGACSYVSHHYQAMCSQVHNYQRLLAWEKKRGLHMDIFKVPSCCTCHIQGYSFVFPPLKEDEPVHHSNAREAPPLSREAPPRDAQREAQIDASSFPTRRPSRPNSSDASRDAISDEHQHFNGGPFSNPSEKRHLSYERPTRSRTRRPALFPTTNSIRRMDQVTDEEEAAAAAEPRELLRIRRPASGSGKEAPPPRRVRQPQAPPRRRNSSQLRDQPQQQDSDRDMDTRHSTINYDYHPILQFFEGYQ